MPIRVRQTGSLIVYSNGALAGFPVTVGGPAGAVQFNTAGYFDGEGEFSYNKNTDTLHLTGSFSQGSNTIAEAFGHAEGDTTSATGNYSHAEGDTTAAPGDYSHAEGSGAAASGTGSHAESLDTTATGDYSHAEGEQTTSFGIASHAEGYQTTATGDYSHAEGQETEAVGNYAHAEGLGTEAWIDHQHAQGKYNIKNNASSLMVVGNGVSDMSRSDVLRVEAGSVQVTGSFLQRNIDTSTTVGFMGSDSAKLPTEKGTDVFFFVEGAIGSKDTTTKGVALFDGDVVVSGTIHVVGGAGLELSEPITVPTEASFEVDLPAAISPALQATSSTNFAGSSSITWSHAGVNPTGVLVVIVQHGGNNAATKAGQVTSVTYGGVAMTQVIEYVANGPAARTTKCSVHRAYFLSSAAIPAGTSSVQINASTGISGIAAAFTFTGPETMECIVGTATNPTASSTSEVGLIDVDSSSDTSVRMALPYETSSREAKPVCMVGAITHGTTTAGYVTVDSGNEVVELTQTLDANTVTMSVIRETATITQSANSTFGWTINALAGAQPVGAIVYGVINAADGGKVILDNTSGIKTGATGSPRGSGAVTVGPNTASGTGTFAAGYFTHAIGSYSVAMGQSTNAVGAQSVAAGLGTIAAASNQVAIGNYNALDTSLNTYFIVGNGTDDSTRSDAFKVSSTAITLNEPAEFNSTAQFNGTTTFDATVFNDLATHNYVMRLDQGSTAMGTAFADAGVFWECDIVSFGTQIRRWGIGINSTSDLQFIYGTSTSPIAPTAGTLKGYVDGGGTNIAFNFTGQHRCTPASGFVLPLNNVGLIVRSTGVISPISGSSMTINDAVPVVDLTSQRNDKRSFGVVSDVEDNTDGTRKFSAGVFVSVYEADPNDNRVYVNSLGEGCIWVSNINGNLENGDYITTCEIPGHGMRQDDDLLHNYTVAKITMDCTFDLSSTAYRCEEFIHEGTTYRRAFVACTYHCG